MKKGPSPARGKGPPIQIKMQPSLSFLSLSLDMFLKAGEAPLCASTFYCVVCKQADDYEDDDGNDDGDGNGLRRSSCRRVERGADNRRVYSRKGTLDVQSDGC